jgi:archaellum component FlaC
MKNKTFAAFLTTLVITSSFTTAFAQTQSEQPVREAIKEKVEERIEAKCDKADNIIAKIIEHYTSTRREHVEKFNTFRKKYDEMVSTLGTKGYNVSELKKYSKNLETKISTYATDLNAFMQSLKESQQLACGESNGKYLEAVKASKELLKKVRTDIQEIKNYYHDTIRPAVINLKNEVKESKSSTQQ